MTQFSIFKNTTKTNSNKSDAAFYYSLQKKI